MTYIIRANTELAVLLRQIPALQQKWLQMTYRFES
jgi:hypothetical protein